MDGELRSVVSLFTGAGGLDIGLEQAGLTTVCASDFEADCIATLAASKAARLRIPGTRGRRRYLQGTRLVHGAVEDLTAADLRPEDVASDWRPDLMAGGPPCQPFSSSGKGLALEDGRGRLFEHFVRLADELAPRLILFENVRGLVTARGPAGEPGEALGMVKAAFEDVGYATRFALLNAADYGSPQRRVRLFMLAARDAPLPNFPDPTHASGPELGARPWVTLAKFLRAMPAPDASEVVRPSLALAAQLASVPPGKGLRSAGLRETTRPGGHWGYKQGTFVADPALPARTVTAASTQDWIRLSDGTLRRLTWREASGLQGFPKTWRFTGSTASRFRQIGNAVPVRLARVIGECIVESLEHQHEGVRPLSAPLPEAFEAAIAYTRRDERQNGASRRRAKALLSSGEVTVESMKGLGTLEIAAG